MEVTKPVGHHWLWGLVFYMGFLSPAVFAAASRTHSGLRELIRIL
jgi:hypothetical protein